MLLDIQRNQNNNKMNELAYTLHFGDEVKNDGRFKKGNIPWNKGKSWKEQGYTEERRKKMISILMENRKKNDYKNCYNPNQRPVIQMDENGERLHWYKSSASAARKLGIMARNIRKVCAGERNFCGGFRWRWDERFL